MISVTDGYALPSILYLMLSPSYVFFGDSFDTIASNYPSRHCHLNCAALCGVLQVASFSYRTFYNSYYFVFLSIVYSLSAPQMGIR